MRHGPSARAVFSCVHLRTYGTHCRSDGDDAGFLRLRDAAFRSALAEGGRELDDESIRSETFASRVASRHSPWNHEGFCDPSKGGIYRSPRRESGRFDRDV